MIGLSIYEYCFKLWLFFFVIVLLKIIHRPFVIKNKRSPTSPSDSTACHQEECEVWVKPCFFSKQRMRWLFTANTVASSTIKMDLPILY